VGLRDHPHAPQGTTELNPLYVFTRQVSTHAPKSLLVSSLISDESRFHRVALAALVAIPVLFNAIALLPELRCPVPSLNDDAFHYLFVQRASQALSNGENPFDHWVPQLELGFPQFFYYQHLPHLAVVALHRLLLQRVSLLTLFNLVRYLLMVLLPITVYWSMRRMEFSTSASAIGAAFSALLSSNLGFGFDFGSYIWRGSGMYTQLWAMHLLFIATASLYRFMRRGTGYLAAVLACSALVLSDLLYAYMMGVTALLIFFVSIEARQR